MRASRAQYSLSKQLPPLRARIDRDEVERFCVYLMHGPCQRSIGVGSSEPAAVSRGRGERNRRVVADSTKCREESADEDRDELTTAEIVPKAAVLAVLNS